MTLRGMGYMHATALLKEDRVCRRPIYATCNGTVCIWRYMFLENDVIRLTDWHTVNGPLDRSKAVKSCTTLEDVEAIDWEEYEE